MSVPTPWHSLPCGPERDAIWAERWTESLEQALHRLGRSHEDLRIARKVAVWDDRTRFRTP